MNNRTPEIQLKQVNRRGEGASLVGLCVLCGQVTSYLASDRKKKVDRISILADREALPSKCHLIGLICIITEFTKS